MKTLSEEELRAYEEQGYVLIPDVFSPAELVELDREIDRIEAANQEAHFNRGWIMSLAQRSDATGALAEDERILSLIERIVQPGIAIYSAKLTAKMPHSPEVCHWHQDDAYYVKYSASQTRMSVWIPLQEATAQNGCLWVIPGSHRTGLQDHISRKEGQCRLSMPDSADTSKAIALPAHAGSVVLFSALLWHSSRGNETDGIRRAFIISYQEATVHGGMGSQWKILRPAEETSRL